MIIAKTTYNYAYYLRVVADILERMPEVTGSIVCDQTITVDKEGFMLIANNKEGELTVSTSYIFYKIEEGITFATDKTPFITVPQLVEEEYEEWLTRRLTR